MADADTSIPTELDIEYCETCKAACPVHTDTRAYVQLITEGRYEEAFEKIREHNPFPSVCGLICHHPCEQACRRVAVDEPVALRNLKRFAVEQTLEHREEHRGPAKITHTETVGVVGSGPAGLTAAADCIRDGYAVTVYEALSQPGGLLACALPKYRLPDEALQQDLDDITALGVDIVSDCRVGRDVSLGELRQRHDAVVLAVGLSESRSLPIENADHAGVLGALPFLRRVALGEEVEVPEQVLVIGGGNVGVDVARTALRLGAEKVQMICLESEDEMPAWDWECREALEEGIEIVHRRGPTRVLIEDGEVVGIELREVERVFDEEGRFAPTYFDDRLSRLDGQMVVMAIGQSPDLELVDDTGVNLTERGLLRFDGDTMSTSAEGVFACGEVVTGPGSAIEAVASGHRAAAAVRAYLETGEVRPVQDEEIAEELDDLPQDVIRNVKRLDRLAMPTLSPEERRRSFVQFELGYSEQDAIREAWRCLSCTAGADVDDAKCEACLTCPRVCPFGVPLVDDTAVMCSDMCQACGLCAVECPANAISIKRFAVGDIASRIEKLMSSAAGTVSRIEIVCSQDAQTRRELTDRVEGLNGESTGYIPVTCAALADEVAMMKPFEFGAHEVVVRMCSTCRYRGAEDRLAKRVKRTKGILDAAGVGGDKLTLQ